MVPLPPNDTKLRRVPRRKRIDRQTLITPNTIKRPSAEDLNAEKVDTAPASLQLPLDREETIISRASTLNEDKISINLPTERMSPKKPLVSAKRLTTPRTIATPRNVGSSSRPSPRKNASVRSSGILRNVTTPRTVSTPRTVNSQKQENNKEDASAFSRSVATPRTPKTPKKPSTAGNINARPPRPRPNVSSQSRRRTAGLSVKSLDKSKSSYVKYANAVFKDNTGVYRKKIRLVGKVQKKKEKPGSAKSIQLKSVTRKEIESSVRSEEPKPKKESSLDIIMVKEAKRPEKRIEIHIPLPAIKEPMIKEPDPPQPDKVEEPPKGNDDNFFVCSNEEDNPYAEFIEMQKKEREDATRKRMEDKFIYDDKDVWPTVVPEVNKKQKDSGKQTRKDNKMNKLYRRVEEVAKFSILRNKYTSNCNNEAIKSKREAVIEQKVLTEIYYNYDVKTKTKIKQRRRRNKRTIDLMKSFKRIPTLVDWVECTDILSTPAMKMQSKLQQNDSTIAFDNVRNQKYKVRTTEQ